MIYCKEHTKSTLMSWSKKDLVDHIQCLEHNNNALEERLEIQAQNCLKLLKEERKQVCAEIGNTIVLHKKINGEEFISKKDVCYILDEIRQRNNEN